MSYASLVNRYGIGPNIALRCVRELLLPVESSSLLDDADRLEQLTKAVSVLIEFCDAGILPNEWERS